MLSASIAKLKRNDQLRRQLRGNMQFDVEKLISEHVISGTTSYLLRLILKSISPCNWNSLSGSLLLENIPVCLVSTTVNYREGESGTVENCERETRRGEIWPQNDVPLNLQNSYIPEYTVYVRVCIRKYIAERLSGDRDDSGCLVIILSPCFFNSRNLPAILANWILQASSQFAR